MARGTAWVCWSSGKDSAWSLHVARQQGLNVTGLLTVVTRPFGRVSMHGVREDVLDAQAGVAGLALHKVYIPASCPHETYRQAMRDALGEARVQGVTQMIFGDLYLEDVRKYRQDNLSGTGIEPLFPLWGRPTRELAEEMIDTGLVAYVTSLDPRRVPREIAGRRFDRELLEKLPAGADPCAENGEFHTCVTGGPMFRQALSVSVGEVVEREGFVFADLTLSEGSRLVKTEVSGT